MAERPLQSDNGDSGSGHSNQCKSIDTNSWAVVVVVDRDKKKQKQINSHGNR